MPSHAEELPTEEEPYIYLPSTPTLPGALVLSVSNTYTRILPLPEQETLSLLFVTVLTSPVTQSL